MDVNSIAATEGLLASIWSPPGPNKDMTKATKKTVNTYGQTVNTHNRTIFGSFIIFLSF